MPPSQLTLLLAFAAGIVSFVSPCVLPLVPAYLGQLTVVAVVQGDSPAGVGASRWLAVRHALAYVVGFAAVFTFLGCTTSSRPFARSAVSCSSRWGSTWPGSSRCPRSSA
jgi:cytochrome c-type biogenesis protein